VPEELAEIEDDFPDGKKRYRAHLAALLPEHFVAD